jgi:hypothetical protein
LKVASCGRSVCIDGEVKENGITDKRSYSDSQVPPMLAKSVESPPFKVGRTDELDIAACKINVSLISGTF